MRDGHYSGIAAVFGGALALARTSLWCRSGVDCSDWFVATADLARRRGARVIATAGSDDKTRIVEGLGADVVVPYRRCDFPNTVREATGGSGVDVVYDGVGRDTFDGSLRCLRRRGTCVLFGGASGTVQSVDPQRLAEAGSVFLTRPHLAHYLSDAKEVRMRATALFDALAAGTLAVDVTHACSLEFVAALHERLETRESTGKMVLSAPTPA